MDKSFIDRYNNLCEAVLVSLDSESVNKAQALLNCFNNEPKGYPYIDFCFFYKELQEEGICSKLCGRDTKIRCPLHKECSTIHKVLNENDVDQVQAHLGYIRRIVLINYNITLTLISAIKNVTENEDTIEDVVEACHLTLIDINRILTTESIGATIDWLSVSSAPINLKICALYKDNCGEARKDIPTCPLYIDKECFALRKSFENPNTQIESLNTLIGYIKKYLGDYHETFIEIDTALEERLLVTPFFISKKRPKARKKTTCEEKEKAKVEFYTIPTTPLLTVNS